MAKLPMGFKNLDLDFIDNRLSTKIIIYKEKPLR
jgi:hypothetical protein